METTIESLALDLSNMDSRLTDLEDKIDAMNIKLQQIDTINARLQQVVDALLGNPLTQSGGFKNDIETINEKISHLEKKQREFDEFRKRFYWTVGIIVAAGLLIEFFISIYTKVK